MPHIASTLSNDVNFKSYSKPDSGAAATSRSVLIKGGANVAQRKLVILGEGPSSKPSVITEISEDDLEFLKGNRDFQNFVKSGHLQVSTVKVSAEKAAKDMTAADSSAPLTGKDSEQGGRLAGKQAKLAKVE
jgi:hypothetical protein